MALREKLLFLFENPLFPLRLTVLRRHLAMNKSKGRQNWVFQCDFKGHFPYLEPLYRYGKTKSDVDIFFAIGDLKKENPARFLTEQGVPPDKIIYPIDYLRFSDWDVYVSPTEWGNVFPHNPDALRVQIFHTLADKNLLYSAELLKFNVIFANGPVHHQFLEKYIFSQFPGSRENCEVINAGFSKIDNLFDGSYSKTELRRDLGIKDGDGRAIVLYAPNWEVTSALNKYGEEVFEELAQSNYLVLIKLHYMSLISKEDHDATLSSENHGSYNKEWVDWGKILQKYAKFENVRVVTDQSINPLLFLSDVMVSDYGGASLEFLCMDKPVVYLDCPEFFQMRGNDIFEYGARSTGYIIDDAARLVPVLDKIMASNVDEHAEVRREMIRNLIYNPGKAAQEGFEALYSIVKKQSEVD